MPIHQPFNKDSAKPKVAFIGAGSTVFARRLLTLHTGQPIYQAALFDLDQIHNLVDELIAAHGSWLPEYQ